MTSLLSTLVRGVVSVRAGLPSWLKPLVPDLSPLLEVGLEFVHHGALVCPSCPCLLWLLLRGGLGAAQPAVAWLAHWFLMGCGYTNAGAGCRAS